MTISLLKSKIHRATVTGASLDYEGSLSIAADLAERVGLRRYERILVGNMANGERFETYVILAEAGSGKIELNGATARLGKVGDRLTIMSYAQCDAIEASTHVPAVIVLDEKNRVVRAEGTGV
jgi:aspartate 1-decarboxylase